MQNTLGSRQNSIRKNLQRNCLNTLGTTLNKLRYLSDVLWETLDKISQENVLCNVFLILFGQHWTDQIPMQYVREAPGNIASEKILCNFALILLAQHCTCQNPVKCCLRGYRQYFIRKNPVQCCLNTLGTTSHRSKPYAMLSKWLQRTLHKKKSGLIFSQCSWDTLSGSKPYAMLPERH